MNVQNKSLETILYGNSILTKKLYEILAETPGNIFFSPISIHACLSLTAQGSGGGTKQELIKALNVHSVEETADGYKTLMSRLNSIEDINLHLANKVYVKDSYKLNETYKNALTKYFASEIDALDFSNQTEAAQKVNSWVESKTNDKIKNLIKPNDLNQDTRLVLVNAIYFKGRWAQPFRVQDTTPDKFYINETDSINVLMMHQTKKHMCREDRELNAKIIELPYVNRDVCLVIILPNKRNGIAEVEDKLREVDLTKIIQDLRKYEVMLSLPRFKMETSINLNEPLSKVSYFSLTMILNLFY